MENRLEKTGLQAVIVLYNCQPQQSPALAGFYQATRSYPGRVALLLYDNSPKPAANLPVLPGLNIVYQHDETNSGLSRAYNVGARMAAQNGLHWVLLLDQDTVVNPDFLAIFASALNQNRWCKLFAPFLQDNNQIVSPFRWSYGRGIPLKKKPEAGSHSLKNLALANSGLIIDVEFFYRVGGYTEEIRLDFSDIDFCQKAGYTGEDFILLDTTLEHSLSALKGENSVAVMIRLTRYAKSARIFAKKHNLFLIIGLRLLIKTLLLTVKFRKLRFLKILFNEYFSSKADQK